MSPFPNYQFQNHILTELVAVLEEPIVVAEPDKAVAVAVHIVAPAEHIVVVRHYLDNNRFQAHSSALEETQ